MAGHADAGSAGLSEQQSADLERDTVEYAEEIEWDAEESAAQTQPGADGGPDRSTTAMVRATSPARLAVTIGVAAFVALVAVIGWLGYGVYQTHRADAQRQLFVEAARQGALNLTTIDWQRVDADVQRIVDSATGTFQSDFSQRSKPFVEVVKQVKSTSVGTIEEAALESSSGDDAQVLVIASVRTSMPDQPEATPKSWRMRISVHRVDADDIKISNVAFVS